MMLSDRYLLEAESFGCGGMCMIWLAEDVRFKRTVAVKFLQRHVAEKDYQRRLFRRESVIMAQLSHPNIIPVFDFGQSDLDYPLNKGQAYYVMRVVRGKTLFEVMAGSPRRYEPHTLETLALYLLKAMNAVEYAHSRGILHLDIKPENIMIDEFDEVYLMDWGLAFIEDSALDFWQCFPIDTANTIGGTYPFAPPEQNNDHIDRIGQAADIYALGMNLRDLFFDDLPAQDGEQKASNPHQHDPQYKGIHNIVQRACALRPEDRYESVAALKTDIRRFLGGPWRYPWRQFGAGETIVAQNEPGNGKMYVVIKGVCDVTKRTDGHEVLLNELHPGDVFGEMAAFGQGGVRTANVKARRDCTVVEISKSELNLDYTWEKLIETLVERIAQKDRA